ncbi:hypothetical protein OSB04_009447 [Centaurea solstitialis]|uniref:J domain-containing protein n=1 Tax=Centaurea solstitialis TaxID=347529 RepID=A0AA38T5P1_9ASTR|nr:hypothetical protein OSB04_009447 [Centaurea solstitialis]
MHSPLFPVPTSVDGTGTGTGTGTYISLRRSSNRNLVLLIGTAAAPTLYRRRTSGVTSAVSDGHQNHYTVLGVSADASTSDIKKAYRLLARKLNEINETCRLFGQPYVTFWWWLNDIESGLFVLLDTISMIVYSCQYHPDVNKDSQAGELFKGIRLAYEVLSNNSTRDHYDRSLQFQTSRGPPWRTYDISFEAEIKTHQWSDLKQRMNRQKFNEWHDSKDRYYPFDDETDDESEEDSVNTERGSFVEVLRSTFLSIFLLKTIGAKLSLTFSSLMAMLDPELDRGYKVGYVIAWMLGGKSGIVLSLCLSFASWVCGKTSSNVVALVVVSMWVGSNLARFAPFPQGALLTLIYMSIKLQADLS